MLVIFSKKRAMLINASIGLATMSVLMAMSTMIMLTRVAVRGLIVRMVAVHDMRWDVMVHDPRDNLNTDDTS